MKKEKKHAVRNSGMGSVREKKRKDARAKNFFRIEELRVVIIPIPCRLHVYDE